MHALHRWRIVPKIPCGTVVWVWVHRSFCTGRSERMLQSSGKLGLFWSVGAGVGVWTWAQPQPRWISPASYSVVIRRSYSFPFLRHFHQHSFECPFSAATIHFCHCCLHFLCYTQFPLHNSRGFRRSDAHSQCFNRQLRGF